VRLRQWLGASVAACGTAADGGDSAGGATASVGSTFVSGLKALADELDSVLDACVQGAQPADRGPQGAAGLLASLETVYLQALECEAAALGQLPGLGPEAPEGPEARALLRAAKLVPPRVLIVAGSDSGGGAGIQADIKSCAALGAFSTTAIAALTAQNSQGVQGIFPVPVDFVQQQMRSVLDDLGTDVIKTGMLATSEIVAGVAAGLQQNASSVERWRRRLVLDPVMVSTSGHVLLQEEAIASVKAELFPLATIITPNLPEAQLLLGGRQIATVEAMKEAARDLCAMGPQWALVKGGHLKQPGAEGAGDAGAAEATDVLCNGLTGECELFTAKLIETSHTHGTGCTLASSIAALLANGCTVPEAVRSAKRYVSGAIAASAHLALGSGPQGPMNHAWELAEW